MMQQLLCFPLFLFLVRLCNGGWLWNSREGEVGKGGHCWGLVQLQEQCGDKQKLRFFGMMRVKVMQTFWAIEHLNANTQKEREAFYW